MNKQSNTRLEAKDDADYLKKIDLNHIWHPFTQDSQWQSHEPLIIERAKGVYLYDVKGKAYLDGVSSLWCNVHGHAHPAFLEAGHEQLEKLTHSTLLGLSHRPVTELTGKLLEFLPKNLSRVFYSDSGTSAVEAALRISLEYWQKKEARSSSKTKIAAFSGAYHGDTLGSVGIGFLDFFHAPLRASVVPAKTVKPPHLYRFDEKGALKHSLADIEPLEKSLKELEDFFEKEHTELAAFFAEPLVQGAAGIWVHPEVYLKKVAALCKKYSVHLIIDEVATGFGKTGEVFAHQHAEIEPDLLVMGKGLSGGMLAISAVAASEEMFSAFKGKPSEGKTFFYGQTFAGNPLAARLAEVNLTLFKEEGFMEGVNNRIDYYTDLLNNRIKPLENVFEIRQKGFMTGIELTSKPKEFSPFHADKEIGLKIIEAAKKRGVFIRPLGNVIVLMPALVMTKLELSSLVEVTAEAIREVCQS